ncbi:MAG: hypothetical protein MZV64_12040 [Ignavibacteriales bacterium]|nr:hypothetical protein [Ignavibacteriales bacterium]
MKPKPKPILKRFIPNWLNQGKISFKAVNLDEADQAKLLPINLGVNGQTLLLVRGDQKINITNEGFMYAVSQTGKFKAVIKEKVDRIDENVGIMRQCVNLLMC